MDLRNARAPREQQITGFVVEHRLWDWGKAPDDPRRGRPVDVYTYPAEPLRMDDRAGSP